MVTRMSFRTTFLLFVKFSYCPLSLSFINSLHYNTKKAKLKSRGRWKGYFPLRPWIPSRTKHVVRQRREGWTSREVLGRRIGSKGLLLWRHNGRPPSVPGVPTGMNVFELPHHRSESSSSLSSPSSSHPCIRPPRPHHLFALSSSPSSRSSPRSYPRHPLRFLPFLGKYLQARESSSWA